MGLKKAFNTSVYVVFALLIIGATHAQPSVLQTGKWYKVAVEKNGVFKIDRNLFKKMGFDPSKTDPRKIKIYGNEGGMLPQANSAARPIDLTELAIQVQGESDGVFNAGDYILFYAQGPDRSYFDKNKETFFFEKNLYADKNFYFVTVSESNGKRVVSADAISGSYPMVNRFENFSYYELDQYNILKSGREWYGEKFDTSLEFVKSVNLGNVVSGTPVKLVSDVMARAFSTSSFSVFINGVQILQQNVSSIPNTQYGIKGRDRRDTVTVNANTLSAPGKSSQEIKYRYTKASSGTSIGHLDYFLIQATQELALYDQQTLFRSTQSLDNPVSTFEVSGTDSQTRVWDVSDPYEPVQQQTNFSSGKTFFTSVTSILKEYMAFSSAPAPELSGSVANQNIRDIPVPNLIIVTHPDFKNEALRLAAHRSSVNNLSVAVVTTQEVYNEFSSGRQDISSIRDFVKTLYDRSPSILKSLLVLGKGSYDYKNRINGNTNLLLIYESRNSLDPLKTYSSDDYFSFLETSEGNWGEEPVQHHTMDIGVGRLPAKNLTDAKNIVDKLIRYDTDPALIGKWRKEIVFVADDGDPGYSHQDDANELAQAIETAHDEMQVKKIFLDNYQQESKPSGQISAETYELIRKTFYDGALVINYTGHGGERLWAQEKIFDDLMIVQLENQRYPLLVTATCEFGRQDDPGLTSSAELCLLRKQGGAIGLVTTARPVSASTNFLLNQAFYDAFFQKENNRPIPLGEIFRRTKNNSMFGVSNRNFSLIGDPSLTLALPELRIKVTEITTSTGSTTLKALSTVTVKGKIVNDQDELTTDFNGVVESTLFDKQTSFVTKGDENLPYTFNQWYNALFRGKATVENGQFEFQFVVPKNIAYAVGEGKLSLFAYDTLQDREASGASHSFQVGLSEENVAEDITSPTLQLYMGDTTFVNGGITGTNTKLVGRLYDLHGINISGYGIGNSIVGALDDTETFTLNDFYEADLDNPTRGTISFPMNGLPGGKHTITVSAWDTYNNPVQARVNFEVAGGENLIIETFGNYPNPFHTSTTLFFTHNRSGDHLKAEVTLYNSTGLAVESYEVDIPESSYHVNMLTLNNADKIRPSGLYLARLSVRSLTDGSATEQVAKLIISN